MDQFLCAQAWICRTGLLRHWSRFLLAPPLLSSTYPGWRLEKPGKAKKKFLAPGGPKLTPAIQAG